MENRLLNTERLKLARVKYYDTKNNGAELSEIDGYAFLYQMDDHNYVNLFDPTEELPVLDRSMYSNVTSSGFEFGNKLIHISGKLEDGPCYVIERISTKALFKKDVVSLSDVRRYVLSSDKFFVDRLRLIKELQEPFFTKARFLRTVIEDQAQMDQLQRYFQEHDCVKQYKK